MISIYRTDQGWYSNFGGTVTYHQDFREAMDAAYRQAARDGALKQGDPGSNHGGSAARGDVFREGTRSEGGLHQPTRPSSSCSIHCLEKESGRLDYVVRLL